ncbi:MAG: adenylate/guanylate cyclase domain-containing protein [Pseudomonadota bacterium]
MDDIIDKRNRAINLKVVFVDIVSYSKRRSQTQAEVVDAFMLCLEEARQRVAKQFLTYSEANAVSFANDLILLPAGDGAAICFPFEGLHDVHLVFALSLLEIVSELNSKNGCEKFSEQKWCNCHNSFYLTVGVAEGKGILYRDVNSQYNVAGNCINMAARIMGHADANQILFSQEAYNQIIDLVDDPHLDERFREFQDVKIKHGLKINLFQYIDEDCDWLSSDPPEDLALGEIADRAMTAMGQMGLPVPPTDFAERVDKQRMIELMAQVTSGLAEAMGEQDGNAQSLERPKSPEDDS